jgi:activator of HSP90 ATPase
VRIAAETSMTVPDKDDPTSRRQVIAGLAVGVAMVASSRVRAEAAAGVVRNVDAIHQEVTFDAPPGRVYALLTDQHEFQKVVALSGAAQSGKIKAGTAAHIGREAGSAFAIFGGFVVGRNIELVPNTRLVQAWRPQDWPAGVYSIVRFELLEHGGGTLLKFDHTGFPASDADNLAQGWKLNYWQPMAAVLARP